MRFAVLAAAAAMTMFGQVTPAAKVAPEAKVTAPAAPTERPLTKDELLLFRSTMAEIRNLREKFHIDEFNEKVQPKVNEQNQVFVAACRSVSVPEDKIQPTVGQSECSLNTGLDNEGNPLKDAAGKPVPPKVWWNKPAVAPDPSPAK
jgi:hypothetical protein